MYSTYLCLSGGRISQPLPENRSLEKIKDTLTDSIKKKVSAALEYASGASIYSPEETVSELNTAQTSVLTLFYGFLFGDLPLCEFIVQVQVSQLKSTFLRVWLVDDFSFNHHDVAMVLSMLSYLLESKKVLIPNHILRIFGGLVWKYGVVDCCSQELLVLFNEGQVTEGEDIQNMKTKKISQSRNNEINNTERNVLSTTFHRMSSLRLKWFQRTSPARTKNVEDEEFVIVTNEDGENSIQETACHPDSNVSEKNENISSSSEVYKELSVVEYIRGKKSLITRKDSSRESSFQKHTVVDSQGRTLLHRLAQFGRTEAIRRLLADQGVNLHVTDYSGKTALHWAVEYNHCSTVELLLKAGADVNARTEIGKTPLSFAYVESGVMSKIWKIIVEYGGTM